MTDHVNTRVALDVQTLTACNYDSTATLDDGSCLVGGCMISTACNYDEDAGCQLTGSCDYSSCAGCTDSTACNFDSDSYFR